MGKPQGSVACWPLRCTKDGARSSFPGFHPKQQQIKHYEPKRWKPSLSISKSYGTNRLRVLLTIRATLESLDPSQRMSSAVILDLREATRNLEPFLGREGGPRLLGCALIHQS
jgi:hypothetical protein